MDATIPQITGCLLLADTDLAGRALLHAHLARQGWEILIADSGKQALEVAAARVLDVAIVDLRLEDLHGLDVLEQIRTLRPGLPVIAVAAEITVEMAIRAMQAGAVDVVAKPYECKALQKIASRWLRACGSMPAEVTRLGGCLSAVPAMAAVLREATRLAPCDTPVAIWGAPGTGRKHLAGAMHQASGRKGPLHAIDASLLSGEQFRTRLVQGIEAAGRDGAVLIGDVQQLKTSDQEPLAKLMGRDPSSKPRFYLTLTDTPHRLTAASRLAASIADKVNSSVLALPPLAARREDIRLLAGQIVGQILPGSAPAIAPLAMEQLVQYEWPGNVRQLRLVLERAARMAPPGAIQPRHLPILQAVHRDPVPVGWTAATPMNLQEIVDNVERQVIDSALGRTGQNQAKAAELLGIPRTTLRDKLDKYGLTPRGKANETGD